MGKEKPDISRDCEGGQAKPSPLRDNERFLQLVFDGISDGLCVLDTEYTIIRVNRYMEKAYATEMPLVGKKCYEAYHGRTSPCDICPSKTTFRTGQPSVEETPYETGGKAVGWMELSSYPITDEGRRVVGMIEYVKYVTDRKKAEKALRDSEEKYRTIFNNALLGLFRTSVTDGMVLEANDCFARMYGYSGREEMVGKVALANHYVNRDDRAKLIEDCRRAKGAVSYESQRYRKDGSVFWMRGSASLNERDECIEGVATDITALKTAERTLRLTQFAVDNAMEAAYLIDDSGRFVYANEAACRMYGYSLEELLNMTVTQTDAGRAPSDTWESDWSEGRHKDGFTHTTGKRRKDGTTFPAELTVKHVVFDNVEYRCVFARDMTDRMALEGQLRQAQKMEAVGRLAGGVAHDFNNVLQGILGTAELALAETAKGEKHYSDLIEIRRGAQRAAELTSQLLAFSRRQLLQPRDVDVNVVVEETMRLLRRVLPENIAVRTLLGQPLPAVNADPTQMQQVLLNLCINARDAMPTSGVLTIETSAVDVTEAYCQSNLSARPGRYVLLSVSDNGVGMDQETLSHMFEPFFTTKEIGRGTGLGLATVYGIVRQHNGVVTAYSEIGRGTTIKVYLPAVERPASSHSTRIVEPVVGGSETVLIAEDQDISKDLAKRVLERNGYRVILASNGREALRLFEENASSIDMVFLDLVMPGLNGHEAFLKMREKKPGLKGAFTTGYSVNALESNLADCAGLTVIAKPYTSSELLRIVRETLDSQQ